MLAAMGRRQASVREIAEAIGHDPKSVRSVLLALSGKGLVKRRFRDDGSVLWVREAAGAGARRAA